MNRNPQKHKAAGFEPAPSWHELVQTPDTHNRADKVRTLTRRVERGQVVELNRTVEVSYDAVAPRAQRRKAKGRGWNPGRLVQHRTRLRAVGDPQVAEVVDFRDRAPFVVACCRWLVLFAAFLLCFLFGCHGSILPFHSSWNLATVFSCNCLIV